MQTDTKIKYLIAWWLEGLSCLMPVSLRKLLQFIPDRITIEFRNNQLIFKYYAKDSDTPDDEQAFILDSDQNNTPLWQWLQQHGGKNTRIVLLVPKVDILKKKMVLPKTAGTNLHQILGFEIDRKTPFSFDQVFYDHIVEKMDVEQNLLHVQLYVTAKKSIEPLIKRLNSWGIKPDSIDITGSTASNGVILAPADEYQPNKNENHTTLILSGTAFCLFIALLYVPLIFHEREINKLEKQVTERRDIVFQLKELTEKKNNTLNKALFLNDKRKDQIPVIAILNELSRNIPDDTWLTRFSMTNGEIQLQGESSSASSMIHIIESSNYFSDSSFRSPITQNIKTKKDKFNLSAKLLNTN